MASAKFKVGDIIRTEGIWSWRSDKDATSWLSDGEHLTFPTGTYLEIVEIKGVYNRAWCPVYGKFISNFWGGACEKVSL